MTLHRLSHLLYLHGFRSSPQSAKAKQVAAWVAAERPDLRWHCPQLPISPREAMAALIAEVAAWPKATMAVIGSSLGGFYATAIAERCGCPAVLLNPAVYPARDLADHIGQTTAWHSEEALYFREEYIGELQALEVPELTHPKRYFAVIAQGDEVLDWREMHARYAAANVKLLDGGDHALSDFHEHWPEIVDFLHLR